MAKDTNEFRVIGPPGCISGDAIVKTNRATLTRPYRLDYIVDRINSAVPGGMVRGNGYGRRPTTRWDSEFATYTRSSVDGIIRLQSILAAYDKGIRHCIKVTTSGGKSLSLTPDHNLFSYGSTVAAGSLKIGDSISVDGGRPVKSKEPVKAQYLMYEGLKFHPLCGRRKQHRFCICKHRAVVEAAMNDISIEQYLREFRTGQFTCERKTLTREQIVHHKNADTYDNRIENLEVIENQREHSRLHGIEGRWKDVTSKIAHEDVVSIEDAGELPTFDITVGHPSGHGNFLANGILCENCGKSTYLADQVVKRSQAWSIANEKPINQCTDVLLASLTKTAAAELRGRGLDLPAGQIGTLHSHALHALGSPKLCVGAKAISQWNKESPLEHWMSGGSTGDDELSVGLAQYNGDRLMSEYTTNRCRLTPRDEWRGPVLEFAERYESWKRLNNMMDYEDLITNAFEQQTDPPGNPSTILGDEQQDSSAADLRLMRYWGSKAQKLILVGDDDQRIFSFRGASEHGIAGVEIPPDHEKVLEQSYRVPRAVHAAAMDVIRRIENRKDVVYYPRDANGQVDRMHYSMRQNPYEVVDEIERLLKEPDEKPGTAKAMCLFSCAYQAQPLMHALKSAGIPFWNPYAVERSNFNPLHPSKGVSTLDRVLAYLKNSEACHGEHAATWTWDQFAAWAEMCSADGWLRHGAKTEIKKRASVAASLTMTVEEIEGLISNEDVMLDLAECDLGWLGKHILEPKRGVYDYVVDIVKKLGYTGITEQPRVCIGTGHSVKGAQAEHVFICPDLSVSGWESYGNYDTRDSIYRLYYVMLTRARQRLILTAPSCPQAVML